MSTRREIREYIHCGISACDFNADVQDIINTLQDIPSKLRDMGNPRWDQYTRFELEWNYGDDYLDVDIIGYRIETETEETHRLMMEEKAEVERATRKEKEERALYENLKKKYG